MNVEAAKEVLARSRSDRREIRFAGYRRSLEGGRTRTIPLRGVNITTPSGFPPIQGPESCELNNLIVGLLNSQGYLLQIGVLMCLKNEALRVYSKSVEGVRKIEVGYIKLSTDGTELGYFDM